jgi:hypothetical protein
MPFFSHLSPYLQNLIASRQDGSAAASTSGGNFSGTTGIGTLNYTNTRGGYSASQLPQVSNPDQALADISLGQHERYIRDFRDFEDALINQRDDTSLIDAARKDAPEQARIAQEVMERRRSRYGIQQTAVEARESGRSSQRGAALNLAGSLNTSRIAQGDVNKSLLGDLINIGQDVKRSSLGNLGTAGQNQVSRQNAYKQAKASGKAQTMGMIGTAGAMLAGFFNI